MAKKTENTEQIRHPRTLPCGHINFGFAGLDSPAQKAARKAGFCCAALHRRFLSAQKTARRGEEVRSVQLPVNWRVRGLHEAVPKNKRRSFDNPDGLCCDPETGLYVGNTIYNDCSLDEQGQPRKDGECLCTFHQWKGDLQAWKEATDDSFQLVQAMEKQDRKELLRLLNERGHNLGNRTRTTSLLRLAEQEASAN